MALTQRKHSGKGRKSSGSPGSALKKSNRDRIRPTLEALALKRRETAVAKREAALAEREAALPKREAALVLRELELQGLEKTLDATKGKLMEMLALSKRIAKATKKHAKANFG